MAHAPRSRRHEPDDFFNHAGEKPRGVSGASSLWRRTQRTRSRRKTLRSGNTDHALQGAIAEGEWFGVLSALDGHAATASVVALTDVEVAALGMADLDDFLFRSGIGARLLRGWLRSLGHQLGRVNRGNEQMLALAASVRTSHDS